MDDASLLSLPVDVCCVLFSSLAVRDVLNLACSCKCLHAVCQDETLWKEVAERKWGPRVRELATPTAGWQAWCKHRMALLSLPRSPLDLVQEQYHDPWHHLAACLLCSRTTGGAVIREAITGLLARYPSPSALLEAPQAEVMEIMRPLGLQEQRYSALVSMSHDFLATNWEDPSVFKGCGKFTCDSWRIFCRGHRGLHNVDDVNLCRFLRWLTKGELPGDKKQRATTQGSRKRKAARPAQAGTLRSGRRRGGGTDDGARGSAGPAAGRRQTRSMAASGA